MNLIDVVQDKIWAIIPEKLDAIHQVLWNHANGVKIDMEALEAQLGKRLENSYDVRLLEGGLAVLPIYGVLAKRMNLFMQISGGTSTELVMRDFQLALEDDDIRAIVLDVDSPGGTVDGTEALGELVYSARGVKPVVAFANGMAASAAYWVASAADIVITEETGEAGSIGVVQVHYDYSRADEKAGVKPTLIYAGKYKTAGNDAEPLGREARDYLQGGVDYMYSIFVETVARNRGVSVEQVLEDMADGRIFIGRQALEAGLADEIGSFETALETALAMADRGEIISQQPGAQAPAKKEGIMLNSKKKTEIAPVTLETLQSEHADLVEQIRAEGADGVNTEEIAETAAAAERERVLGLAGVQLGEETAGRLRAVVESGVTVEQFTAVSASQPEAAEEAGQGKMGKMLEAIQDAGPDNPGQGGRVAGPANFEDAWKAIEKDEQCGRQEALKRAVARFPELHKAYLGEQEPAGSA